MGNKLIFALCAALFFLVISFVKITPVHALESSPSHLKYFGYMSYDGLTPDISSNYFSEMASLGNTNIAWSYAVNAGEFAQRGIRPMITDVRWTFFSGGELSPNWQANWTALQARLGNNAKYIYGFYFDEPVWNGYSKDAFVAATRAIRETYPDKAVVVIEAAPPFINNSIPDGYYQYVTDIGFDYYFVDPSANNDQGWAQYQSIYAKFAPYAAGKNVWLIPDGYGNVANMNRWPNAWDRYIQFAREQSNVIGIFGFIYQNPGFPYTLRSILTPGSPQYIESFRYRQQEVGLGIVANSATCKEVKPDVTTTTSTSGNFIAYAMGIENATAVDFYVWSDVQGINSYTHYPGTNLNFGTWRTTIDLANHPGIGKINVRVYMNVSASDPNGILCGTKSFERLASVSTPTPTPKPGDLNADGKVDGSDNTIFVSNFGKIGSPGFIPADIDKNGKVDIFDYNVLVGNFGK